MSASVRGHQVRSWACDQVSDAMGQQAACEQRQEAHEAPLPPPPFPASTPEYSSQSNGVVERCIQSFAAQIRVMRSALEERWKTVLAESHEIWPCQVDYSGFLLNRCEVGHDGKTAYERSKRNIATVLGLEFGEILVWQKRLAGALSPKWDSGGAGALSCTTFGSGLDFLLLRVLAPDLQQILLVKTVSKNKMILVNSFQPTRGSTKYLDSALRLCVLSIRTPARELREEHRTGL